MTVCKSTSKTRAERELVSSRSEIGGLVTEDSNEILDFATPRLIIRRDAPHLLQFQISTIMASLSDDTLRKV